MEKIVIVNFSKEIIKNYDLSDKEFYRYSSSFSFIKKIAPTFSSCGDNFDQLFDIIRPGVSIVISDYEFISPKLEDKGDYHFIELCISETEFKFYNFNEDLIGDINNFCIYKGDRISKEYYTLIYRFLSYVLLDKPINIKSANSIFEENTDL